MDDVGALAGTFVVEVGYRQAWPFLGLADNRPTPPVETRLYIDAAWSVGPMAGGPLDDLDWLTAASALLNDTVESARITDGALHLVTATGLLLIVSGAAGPDTTGEPWRLHTWR